MTLKWCRGETKLCAIIFLCVSERLRFFGKTGTGTTATESVKSSKRSDSKTFNQTFPIRNVISTILTFCEKVFRNLFWVRFFRCSKINLKKYFKEIKVLFGALFTGGGEELNNFTKYSNIFDFIFLPAIYYQLFILCHSISASLSKQTSSKFARSSAIFFHHFSCDV